MKPLRILFISLFVFFASCDENNDNPSNEFTINSSDFKGFSFDLFKVVDYPGPQNPDFFVLVQIENHGELKGPYLSHSDLEARFYMAEEFEDSESAKDFYTSYLPDEEQTLQQFALNVKPNQVWLVKTNSGGYGKILILKTRSGHLDDKPFAEIAFKADLLY
jgi:hypothetical protein